MQKYRCLRPDVGPTQINVISKFHFSGSQGLCSLLQWETTRDFITKQLELDSLLDVYKYLYTYKFAQLS